MVIPLEYGILRRKVLFIPFWLLVVRKSELLVQNDQRHDENCQLKNGAKGQHKNDLQKCVI